MLVEDTLPITERKLRLVSRLTVEEFEDQKRKAIAFCAAVSLTKPLEERSVQALQRLNTFFMEKEPNYRAVVVYHCYADVPAFRSYRMLYSNNDPTRRVQTTAILQFSIFWSRLPQLSLEHGHHQVAVFYFPEGIPLLIDELPTSVEKGMDQLLILADRLSN